MTKVALLVGVSEYEPGLTPLPGSVRDVEAMRKILHHPKMGGFEQVQTLTNPDPLVMQSEIEALFRDRAKDDLVLFFFSGHGVKDDRGRLYFATRLTRKTERGELVRSTAVPANFIHDIMSNSRSKRQVVILDCCFSGAFAEGMTAKDDQSVDVATQLGGEGRAVLTSSTATQYSFEQTESDLSIYTRYIVEGIESGAADMDSDGWIAIDELHDYAQKKVREAAPAMRPKIYAVEEGFRILLAQAPMGDPQLIYRKEVEQFASQGEISDIGRLTLNALRTELQLADDVADEIEATVLKPFRDYQAKLKQYEQAWQGLVQRENPVSDRALQELDRFQDVLGLRDQDTERIKQKFRPQTVPTVKTEPEPVVVVPPPTVASAPTPKTTPISAPPPAPKSPQRSPVLTPAPAGQSRWPVKIAIGSVLLLSLGFGVVRLVGRSPEPPISTLPSPVPSESVPPSPPPEPTPVPKVGFTLHKTLTGHQGSVWSLAVSPDGKMLYSGSEDRQLNIWEFSTGTLTHTVFDAPDAIRAIAPSPDGKTLATSAGGNIQQVSVAEGKSVGTFASGASPIWSLAISPNGEKIASTWEDKHIQVWNWQTGEALVNLKGHTDLVYAIAISPNNNYLVSGSQDKTIRVWDLANANVMHTLAGHTDAVRAVAISPDGRTIASGSWDKMVRLWDLTSGKPQATLFGHRDRVVAVAFSPDGTLLASGSSDNTIKIWEVKTGKLLQTLDQSQGGHSDWVLSLAFSKDSRTLISGSKDQTIKLWQRQ